MGTTIKITPPGGMQSTVTTYYSCQTLQSVTDRAGSFGITFKEFDNNIIDKYPVGSDVIINQNGNMFRGWIINPPKALNGIERMVSLEGASYTAKTQKVIVTESYTSQTISNIVVDLFESYSTWATVDNVSTCAKKINISFADNYLWEAMEQLCKVSNYDWYIDSNLSVNFFDKVEKVSTITLSGSNYKRGTANFAADASGLVNYLLVKGGKAISDLYAQPITVGADPIPLYYTPRAPIGGSITATVDGVSKSFGIQNITDPGTKDFLLNYSEKLLVPDLCTSGTGVINYCYEYPIKLLLEDPVSQAAYGKFDGLLKVETDNKIVAREMGIQHLVKYSNPIVRGNIQTDVGVYNVGELIKVEIPNLLIDDYFQIKQLQIHSTPLHSQVDYFLNLETQERDTSDILKEINDRMTKIENSLDVNASIEVTVEQYRAFDDNLIMPIIVDNGTTYNLHQYEFCSTSLLCSATLFI